ncbi:protein STRICTOSIDINE SYNTHASE-LIKE 5-like [Humulus lupulus]|uniref:protein STRICTOSIDINE SYNTHASE-LIKE 5-like n=1 Tax=Humulus lupulus TaxID=3486 RepID=UPI002B409823|nr:protein STRICTOSIDINE SYNTHASE-LIKE 5-like [Humulus lupulus]
MADVDDSQRRRESSSHHRWPLAFLTVFVAFPVAIAVVLYRSLDSFEAAALPIHEFSGPTTTAAARNGHMLRGAERVGEGALLAPEDLAYDSKSGVVYTGCADGWVKRVRLSDSVVENWVNTGGRPLGIVLDRNNNQVLVADSGKGLLSITKEGVVELLTEEAEGVKFMLTDGLDVAEDGIIYFTDASHKYGLDDFMWDILEANPNGRLLSYDPRTNQTKVLLHDLYFANGVSLSPDQTCLIFCETPMRRCRKYHLKGERKGSVEPFIDFLPGMPDNIRYDGEGHYWIALVVEFTLPWDLTLRYPFIRKVLALLERYNYRPNLLKGGGVFGVDLEGRPIYHYHDPKVSLITSGLKIGNYLYCGSVANPYIIRLNLLNYPAQGPTTTPPLDQP